MAGAPYWKGLRPIESISGNTNSFPTETFQAAPSNSLYVGQVVSLDAQGRVVPSANSDATVKVLGVVAGLFYPRANARPVHTQSVTAAENSVPDGVGVAGWGELEYISFAAGEGVGVQVYVDPSITYAVKASEAIEQGDLGELVQLVDNVSGASVTHTGTVPPGDASEDTLGGILRILNVFRTQNTDLAYATTNIADATGLVNDFGSPETIVKVRFESANLLFA